MRPTKILGHSQYEQLESNPGSPQKVGAGEGVICGPKVHSWHLNIQEKPKNNKI